MKRYFNTKSKIYFGLLLTLDIVVFLFVLNGKMLPVSNINAKDEIIMSKKLSEIENTYYNVKDYGAVGDGVTDDTKAIKEVIKIAYNKSATAYFPSGSYLLSETINIMKNDAKQLSLKGDGDTKIIGAKTLNGNMFTIKMKYNFQIMDIKFEHNGGSGNIIFAVFIRAYNCEYTSSAENVSPLVEFHGSDCKISACKFTTNNAEAYSLYYSMLDKEISINDYIIDNHFTGTGKGIVVGDGKFMKSGRSEGLKINGNTFENTGAEQICIQEILHVDIANNALSGSTGSAIVLQMKGHGPDGVFINGNDISADFAGIKLTGNAGDYLSMTVISDNLISGGQYGFHDTIGGNKVFIRSNTFKDQSVASVYTEETNNLMIMSNKFIEASSVYSLDVTGKGKTIIDYNELGSQNKVNLNGEKKIQKF